LLKRDGQCLNQEEEKPDLVKNVLVAEKGTKTDVVVLDDPCAIKSAANADVHINLRNIKHEDKSEDIKYFTA